MSALDEHPFQRYESSAEKAHKAASQSAEQGASLLFAYGFLLLVCGLSAVQQTDDNAAAQAAVDSCARGCAHAGGLVLFTALSIKGYLPGKRKKTLRKKSQAYLARLLLLFVGLGFLWRAYYLHAGADGGDRPAVAAATGAMVFLGILGLVLGAVAHLSSRTIAHARKAR